MGLSKSLEECIIQLYLDRDLMTLLIISYEEENLFLTFYALSDDDMYPSKSNLRINTSKSIRTNKKEKKDMLFFLISFRRNNCHVHYSLNNLLIIYPIHSDF